MAEPLLFLSHAGADTAAAAALTRRLKAAGIHVWFDRDSLAPGSEAWQRQIERAIWQDATCFAVYVGSRGVVNWVEAEVRVALSRAISGNALFPFVPILSADIRSAALPPFARQFQTVRDVENEPAEWNRLLQAIVQGGRAPPETHPFFGLQPIDEIRSHLFFGRRAETREVVERITERNLVLVAGDSGSGKSSLVLAGLVPAWRGNEVGLLRRERPSEYDWHVVVTRPLRDPRRVLAERIEDAGRPLGRSAKDLEFYAKQGQKGDASEVRRALRCGLTGERTRTLLVVDQFEELIHPLVPSDVQEKFAALLAELADPADPAVAVALTMRSDYTNLLRKPELQPLYERLEAERRRARFVLGRIESADPQRRGDLREPDGLRAVVTKPLRLAGRPLEEAEALAHMVVDDVGTRPGDLALVQFALTRAWDARGANGENLLQAYASVGRVEGALAQSAEDVFQNQLGGEANEAVISAALIRLGSLSATGTTRRLARRAEFSDAGWKVIQKLASREGNRLVLIGGEEGSETPEIAHEALLTQWERLDAWLRSNEADKRSLDALAERAAASPTVVGDAEGQQPSFRQATGLFAWVEQLFGLERPHYREPLLQGSDLKRFGDLARKRPTWLSVVERELVERSEAAAAAEVNRDGRVRKLMQSGLAILGILVGAAALLWIGARREAARAERELGFAVSLQPMASMEIEAIFDRISRDKVANTLEPFLPSLSRVIDNVPGIINDLSRDSGGEVARNRRDLLLKIGWVFQNYGMETHDRNAMDKAKTAFEAVLKFEDRTKDVNGWASAQISLANSLLFLGGTDGGPNGESDLRKAVTILQNVLGAPGYIPCDKQVHKNVWNDLAAAYLRLGLRGRDTEMDNAELMLQKALKCEPTGGMVHYHLGVAYEYLGLREIRRSHTADGQQDLKRAEGEFGEALKDYTSEGDRNWWAMILTDLGETQQVEAHHQDAIETFKQAEHVYTREQFPNEWARLQADLGISYERLGEQGDDSSARMAVEFLSGAEQVYSGGRTPVQWARILYFRCAAWLLLGEHGDKDALKQAIDDCGNAVDEADRDHLPVYNGTEHYDTSSFAAKAKETLSHAKAILKGSDAH